MLSTGRLAEVTQWAENRTFREPLRLQFTGKRERNFFCRDGGVQRQKKTLRVKASGFLESSATAPTKSRHS